MGGLPLVSSCGISGQPRLWKKREAVHSLADSQRSFWSRFAAKLFLGTSISTLGFMPVAHSQTSEPRVAEHVTVTSERYGAAQLSLSKLPAPLQDTPQSVTIVSSDLLRERGTSNLNDALRNTPGISLGRGNFPGKATIRLFVVSWRATTCTWTASATSAAITATHSTTSSWKSYPARPQFISGAVRLAG